MTVLLANTRLAVRRRPLSEISFDDGGYPIPAALGPPGAAYPGAAQERADHSWLLRLDPALWPVTERDVVREAVTGREWVVLVADLLENVADSTVNYVRVEAAAYAATGGTRPPGSDPAGPV